MSREFVTNVGGAGNSFRISFSEEKPEPKVSKLTLSSDFTHSFEEGYEDQNDVLVVDIDYGDGIANEDNNGNDTDSPESISRSSSVSSSSKKERPKIGLKRFKSVEETINVSPTKPKKKLKKTVSDYEARYKGLEKKEARLTLSADFTHSYEENFDEDGDVLIVDIDYSQGEKGRNEESFEDRVFSASDDFGRAETENGNGFRKYYSHEDIRSPSLKKRDLERSSSGYEITFINESAPDERKKLSLSADLSTSSEEILHPTDVPEAQQAMKNKQELSEEEVFKAEKYYLTSTPQKSVKNAGPYADNQTGHITVDAYEREEVFEELPEKAIARPKSAISDPFDGLEHVSAQTPLKTPDWDSGNFINTDYRESYINSERKEEEEMLLDQRKEDERSMKNIEKKEPVSDGDNMAQWHHIDAEVLSGSEGAVGTQSDDGGTMAWKDSLEIGDIEVDTSRGPIELNKATDSEDVIVPLELRDVENTEETNLQQAILKNDVEAEKEGSSEIIGDDMKIDLDDILIIDMASNDQESTGAMTDESNPLEGDTDNIDDVEIRGKHTSKRAEVYIYSLNETGENENAAVCDENLLISDDDISQKENKVSSNVIDNHMMQERNDSVDEELNSLSKKRHSVDEEPSLHLQQTYPSDFGGKMRLLELAGTSGEDENSSLEDREDENIVTDDNHLISGKEIDLSENNENENGVSNQWRDDEDQHGNSDLNEEKNDNSCSQQIQVNENVSRDFEAEPETLENSVDTGSCKEVDEIVESRSQQIQVNEDVSRDFEAEPETLENGVDTGSCKEVDEIFESRKDDGIDVHVDDNEDIDDDDVEVNKQQESGDKENANQKKFFKMIIIREVASDYSNMEIDEEDETSSVMTGRISRSSFQTNEDSQCIDNGGEETAFERASKSEYIFPMPIGTESMSRSEDIAREDEFTGHEDAQYIPPEEDDTQMDTSNENEGILKRLEWPDFWGFFRRVIPKRFAWSPKKGSHTDSGPGPIPNGACKTADDDDDDGDVILSPKSTGNDAVPKTEWPKLINKVYRLKNIHNSKKLLTETIRIFLRQEDVLSFNSN